MNGQQPIQHLDDVLRNNSKPICAVLYMRVSTAQQEASGNVRYRLKYLYRYVKKLDCLTIVEHHYGVEDGHQLENRPMLKDAIQAARIFQAENPDVVVIVATDVRNRLLRRAKGKKYRKDDPEPHKWQWEELRKMAKGVILATILPPDAPHDIVHSFETSLPKNFGKQCGRPPEKPKPIPGAKKRRRERLMPRAEKLWRQGKSLRAISRRLRVSISTIRGWKKRWS